jgi:hypothetical protein
MSKTDIGSIINQLNHKSSPKRRAAAKKLRKLKEYNAGSSLLSALKNEINDKRTWETQYQMIMALGECGYTPSLDFLIDLSERTFEATMIYVALGDSTSRLSILNGKNHNQIIITALLKKKNPMFIDGVVRSIVMLKLILNEEAIKGLLEYSISCKE